MSAAVVLDGLAVRRDGREVLHGVCCEIAEGERVGLVGRNGAGKTTLLQSLLGLHAIHAGRVSVCGCDATDREETRQIRRLVGMVFQRADDQLFAGTVEDDVAFGPLNLGLDDAGVRDRIDAALAAVSALDLRDRVSHHLSAGEKRRVAIATALAMQPRVLVLDEPTSELDPSGRRAMIELLGGLDQTLLIASHDLDFVLETCRRVIVLDDGAIAADGPAEVTLADAALMRDAGLEVPYALR